MNEFSKVPANGENATPEGAALILLQIVASVEGKEFGFGKADRKWILDTYTECLQAVRYERMSGR
jgi:hypothetical protein